MAEHLFISMGDSPDQATMVVLNADGQLLARPERVPLSVAAERAADRQVTVLLPARDIVSCTASLPSAPQARLRQMLPFTLEDEFAGDVEELHFAAGERNDADRLAAAVIARGRFEFWLDALRSAGIAAKRIVSRADAVPDTPGVVTLFLEGPRILGRRPRAAPFAFEELALAELWQLLAAEKEDTGDLGRVVLFADPETLAARKAEIDAWRPALEQLDIKELEDGCLPRLAANLLHQPGTNLLQGPYAPRSSYAALARPWHRAAGLLLAVVALGLVGKGALAFKLGRDESRLLEEITAVCAASYSSSELNACRLEMRRRLDAAGQTAAGGAAGFLGIQAVVAEAGGGVMRMQSMSYRDGVLSLDFLAPGPQFVASFSEAVRDTGRYQVIDPSMRNDGDDTRVQLRIAPVGR